MRRALNSFIGIRLGENPDIDAVAFHDQTLHRIRFPAAHPSVLLAVTDEDLGDSMSGCELKDGRDGVLGVKHFGGRVLFGGASQVVLEDALVIRLEVVLLNVDYVQLAVKTVRLPAAAANHQLRVRAGRDAHQNALMGAVSLLDSLAAEIFLKLMIHHVGGQHQRYFAKLGKLALELIGIQDRLLAAFE